LHSDDFEIHMIREAISQDWSNLASKNLSATQRKTVREHLEMNVNALCDLVERNQLARQKRSYRRRP
jgi:hypothetical protein